MTNSFQNVFGGTTIYPSDVSYLALTLSSNITLEWPLEASEGPNVVARIIDVTTTGIYTITMPDATKVGVGQTVLFNNLGPDIVTVVTAAGNAILSISAGQQWQIYLTDNTTAGGSWRTFRYGAATAQAQASALAGPGLKAAGSILEQNLIVIPFSTTPTAASAPDRSKVFVWTGSLGTFTLPSAPSVDVGWFISVRNNGTGDLTIDPSGSETINGGLTLTLQPGDSAEIVTDGVSWYTVGLGQSAEFAFDYTSIVITGGTYTLSGSELNRVAYKFSGALTSNALIIVPATIQQYWINNVTTGAYTLSVKANGSSSPIVIPQNEANIYYCDGTNIVQAQTTAAFGGVLGITQGGTGSTTAPGALTNLGGTGIGTSVFTAASTAAARTAIAAAGSGANSDITSLSGLTTPLSVGQGGTGSATAAGARTNLGAAASGANSDITSLTNTAGIQIGAPTGGAQGNGTLNTTGLFINGVAVGTGSGSVTSVNMSVPSFLSVTGGPITTSGTLAVSLSGTALPTANGGTGQTSYTDGQVLIGNTATGSLSKSTLTAGSGITITNGNGSITIASTAGGGTVTSVAVSGGSTGLTTSGGPITGSGTITLGGTLAIANGGTGGATAAGARLNLGAAASGANNDITSLTGLTTALSVAQGGTGQTSYTDGQLLIGNTATGSLSKATLTAGSGISITNGNGSITITSTSGGGSVTSVAVSGGTTGLTTSGGPITGAGTITIGGTLAVSNGGTGATTAAGARTNLDVPSTGGSGATGTWGISISGNAATATSATTASSATTATTATTANNVSGTVAIANGGTGSTTAAGARTNLGLVIGTDIPSPTGTGASGTWSISINGNAATATSATSATTATTATTANALNTGNNYQVNSLGVGTAGSGTAGEIRATNNVTAYYTSDIRFKENIADIQDALGVVQQIGGKTFDWTDAYIEDHGGEDGYFVRKKDFGVIAQDVEQAFPLAVRQREDGSLAVDYDKLVAVAFRAINELRAEVEMLRAQVGKDAE